MEHNCRTCDTCGKLAHVICTCDENSFFCYEHGIKHQKLVGEHYLITLIELKEELHNKINLSLNNLNKARDEIMYRSHYLIQTIITMTKAQILNIELIKNKTVDLINIEYVNRKDQEFI